MKTKLEQFTMAEFIDLVAGDTSVLLPEKGDTAEDISKALRDIIYEYRAIVDPSGMKGSIMETEDLAKARITLQVLTMCSNILALGDEQSVRVILEELGINVSSTNSTMLKAVVKSRIAKAKASIAEIEKALVLEKGKDVDVRRRFDEQAAALMTYFKFQISMDSIKATIYAHMVAQYNREIKALNQARKRK